MSTWFQYRQQLQTFEARQQILQQYAFFGMMKLPGPNTQTNITHMASFICCATISGSMRLRLTKQQHNMEYEHTTQMIHLVE